MLPDFNWRDDELTTPTERDTWLTEMTREVARLARVKMDAARATFRRYCRETPKASVCPCCSGSGTMWTIK